MPSVSARVLVVSGNAPERAIVTHVLDEGVNCWLVDSAPQPYGIYQPLRFQDEGVKWARGWDTPEADALRVFVALDQQK